MGKAAPKWVTPEARPAALRARSPRRVAGTALGPGLRTEMNACSSIWRRRLEFQTADVRDEERGLRGKHRRHARLIDGMVLGRVAYEALARFWPTAGPEMSETQRRRIRELPKYVLSHTPMASSWHNSQVLAGGTTATIRALAGGATKDIAVFAGAAAVRTTLGLGILDELRLVVHPVLVGSGTPLFDAAHPTGPLRLLKSQQFDSGVVVLR